MYKSFIFFDLNDHVLFHRNDAEEAEWTHQDLSLSCVFPYDPQKVLSRGMRIGFEDSFGRFQIFEIRQCRDTEPDHAQAITAEHIAISELTDRHLVKYKPDEEVSAQTAITALLDGTGWSIGTCTSTATHKPEFDMTSVWSALTEVRDMMGLRLEPYVTVSDTAITGRYINVVDNEGVWRGVRLSINKNIDQIGVTYEDTSLVTAVYGYGASVDDEYTPPSRPESEGDEGGGTNDQGDNQLHSESSASSDTDYGADYVTIKNVVWEQTADHPAKPSGQMYLEDPAATALYGRNGQPRFGFYSNSNVDDPEELIELCWEALKRQNSPKVTIECTCSMLYALGYGGEQIQIGDTVRVEIEPINVTLELMCICLTEDLLNPENTRPTIGRYIKDIVYITKEEEHAAGGGGGGGGGANEDKIEQQKNVYTKFDRTDEYILMQAVSIESVEGALNTAYSEIYMNAQEIALEVSRATGAEATLSSRIQVNADAITLEVTNRTNAVAAINLTLDGINITGNVINIKGKQVNMGDYVLVSVLQADYLTAQQISSSYATISTLQTDYLSTTQLAATTLNVSGLNCSGDIDAQGVRADSMSINGTTVESNSVKSFGTATSSGGQISIPVTMLNGTAGTPITFNIADTSYYQQGVSAAHTAGYNEAVAEFNPVSLDIADPNERIYLYKYGTGQEQLYTTSDGVNFTPAGQARYWYYNASVDVQRGNYALYRTGQTGYYTRTSS